MKWSLQKLCEETGLAWDRVYVWLDILSIPQINACQKSLAVNSLYTYAGMATYLVIVSPDSIHKELKTVANVLSYKERVWCRAEQLAFYCFNGRARMFLALLERLEKVPDNWMDDVACVFNGSMTCCSQKHKGGAPCDRQSLVAPLMGMYFDLYTKHKAYLTDAAEKTPGRRGSIDVDGVASLEGMYFDSEHKAYRTDVAEVSRISSIGSRVSIDVHGVWGFIQDCKAEMFPATFEYVSVQGASRKELFGNMIGRIEKFVDENFTEALALSTADGKEALSQSHTAPAHSNVAVIVPASAPKDMYGADRPKQIVLI